MEGRAPDFDFEGVFDEDYLYFYEPVLTDERSDQETDLLWQVLGLEPAMEVLDLACGHGRIANRLAARGCRVTGLDRTQVFLDRARRDAAERSVEVEYIEGDMRRLRWRERFDRVLIWFTAYGYFSDDENRSVLTGVHGALRRGGRLLISMPNRDAVIRNFQHAHVGERGEDFLVDRSRFDPLTNRVYTKRTIIRDGRVRHTNFFVRFFTFPEFRDWLLQAGFRDVVVYGPDGTDFSLDARQMIVVAEK